jgi:perosamine synthetase
MFDLKREFGEHKIYSYDKNLINFIDFFKKLYKYDHLECIHLISSDYEKYKNNLIGGYLNDRDTDLHRIFYDYIKSNDEFKILYCDLIKKIHTHFFPNEEVLIYQSYPSIRIQFFESKVIPEHKDSDSLSNHPLGEKNFILPITTMKNTNTIYIESEPDKKDFKNIDLEYGELLYFNGNTCTHYNVPNKENNIRISLDFRIILKDDYMKYVNSSNIIKSNPRDNYWKREPKLMMIGGYYQVLYKNSNYEDMFKWYNIKNNIIQHRPFFGIEEANACHQYMLEDNFITEHKKTLELENMVSTYLNCKHCIMTTSGTSAILLALMSLDLKEDDEIIVPNYTMIATINAVKLLKLKPIIIDVDTNTFTINIHDIMNAVTTRTRGVIHVSLNNRYKDINSIVDFCNKNNLYLIEDAAQSLGCCINGKNLGTFGKIGCFSLSTPKIISTGQGGFCVTDDDEIAKKINMIKNFGRKESGIDDFEIFGINLKFTDIQAVIGIEQMKKIDYRVKRMREIYNLYYENLKHLNIIKPVLSSEWIPWFVDIYVENRNNIIDFLKKHNILTRPVYSEINKTNVYYSNIRLKNSEYVCNHGLFLPSFITITNDEINYICSIIKLYVISQK